MLKQDKDDIVVHTVTTLMQYHSKSFIIFGLHIQSTAAVRLRCLGVTMQSLNISLIEKS